jgi:hypothetical protein
MAVNAGGTGVMILPLADLARKSLPYFLSTDCALLSR